MQHAQPEEADPPMSTGIATKDSPPARPSADGKKGATSINPLQKSQSAKLPALGGAGSKIAAMASQSPGSGRSLGGKGHARVSRRDARDEDDAMRPSRQMQG